MDEVFAQSKKFFGLPTDEKMKVLKNKISRGYTPLFDERLGPSDQVNGDHKEGYYIGVEIPADDSEAPNVWPDADLLLGWRQTMQEYLRQALEVARTVARGIALALDLDANFFDKREMLGDPNATLRLLHYNGGPKIPRQVSDPSRGIYGAGAHSDFGLITLLATDDVPGLQICKNKDAEPQLWEDVAPLKGRVSKSSSDNIK